MPFYSSPIIIRPMQPPIGMNARPSASGTTGRVGRSITKTLSANNGLVNVVSTLSYTNMVGAIQISSLRLTLAHN